MPRALHQRRKTEGSERRETGNLKTFLLNVKKISEGERASSAGKRALTRGYVLLTAEMMPFFVENEAHYGDKTSLDL